MSSSLHKYGGFGSLPKSVTWYMVLSGVVILVLLVLLVKCRNKNIDHFCVCSGGLANMNQHCNKCQNVEEGLTEYSDFAQLERDNGGPYWTTVSPGDLDFTPRGQGCDTGYAPADFHCNVPFSLTNR